MVLGGMIFGKLKTTFDPISEELIPLAEVGIFWSSPLSCSSIIWVSGKRGDNSCANLHYKQKVKLKPRQEVDFYMFSVFARSELEEMAARMNFWEILAVMRIEIMVSYWRRYCQQIRVVFGYIGQNMRKRLGLSFFFLPDLMALVWKIGLLCKTVGKSERRIVN